MANGWRLAVLECRRMLGPGILVALLIGLGLALALLPDHSAASEIQAQTNHTQGALLRRSLWEIGVLLLFPSVGLSAAALVSRWRAGEADWLAPRISRTGALLATSSGMALGAALLTTLPALFCAGTPRPEVVLRLVHNQAQPQDTVVLPTESHRFTVDSMNLPANGRLRMRVRPGAGSGRVSDVRLALVRGDRSAERVIALQGATWIEIPIPEGNATLAVGLRNESQGKLHIRADECAQVFAPPGDDWAHAFDIWLRVLRAALVLLAVALGCGAWMGPGLGAGLTLALPLALAWVPVPWLKQAWDDFLPALDFLGQDRLLPVVGPGPWLCAGAWIGAGLLLARLGLRNWSGR